MIPLWNPISEAPLLQHNCSSSKQITNIPVVNGWVKVLRAMVAT